MSSAVVGEIHESPWATRPFAELARTFSDGDWIESKDQSPSGVRLLQTGNVGIGEFKDRSEKARYITAATFERLNCTDVLPGDILVSRLPDPVGRACIVPKFDGRSITAVDCTIVRLNDELLVPEFFVYFSQSDAYLKSVSELCTGSTRSRISRSALGQIGVPLPPLEEQKRIVAKLDQAFAALDRVRVNAEANLADARGLQAQALEDVLSDPELGKCEPCGSHVDLLSGFAFKSAGYSVEEGDIRLVRGDNIVQGGFRWSGVMRWPESDRAAYQKYELAKGDVLVAMDRTWVSAGIKYAVVDEEALPSLLVQRVARLRALPSLLPAYLAAWIGSPLFERYVLSIQTGLGVPHVSGGQIESFEMRVPSLGEQSKVVRKLGEVLQGCEKLSMTCERNLADIAALRQSLLHAAFSGQLT